MKVRFWGTRGSIPSPVSQREIQGKLYRAIRGLPKSLDFYDDSAVWSYIESLPPLVQGTAGGNTPCVEVRNGDDLLVLDAGTGLRELGMSLMRGPFGQGQGTLHLFISHPHWDHIQGFPMFVPAFIPGNKIFIYGFHDLRAAFDVQQQPLTWPVSLQYMSATIEFVPLTLGQTQQVGGVRVDALKNHHPGASYSYRMSDGQSTIVYATDVEYKQLDDAAVQRYVRFFRRADVLVFDSQYTLREAWKKEDWGHSSALIGVDLARAAGVKRLLLFHHDPTYSDRDLEQMLSDAVAYQAQDPWRPGCEIAISYEGLEIELGPERAIDWQLAPDGGTAILTSARVFDELSVALVAQQLESGGASSIIDLSQVEALTTGGVRALVTLQQKQPGRDLALVASSERVRQVIRLTGYQDCFAVYPSVEAALAAVAAREAAQLPGQVIGGRYQIESRVGEDSLGPVLRVLDLETQERCVLRLLAPTFSQERVEGLLQQARQIVGMEHRSLIRVLAWERRKELVYGVEALSLAPTLESLVAAGTVWTFDQLLSMAQELSSALEYAHNRGVIHGDLRMGNIYVNGQGIQVGGFGLGRLMEGRNLLEAPLLFQDSAYLAPEQILGQPLDTRTDLYALGVILYRLFTGQLPFEGEPAAILEGHLHQEPLRPRQLNPLLSPLLEHLLLKLLAKNPAERYSSAQQTRRILSTLLSVAGIGGEVPAETQLLDARQSYLAVWECNERLRSGEGGKPLLPGDDRDWTIPYRLVVQVLQRQLTTTPRESWGRQVWQLFMHLMGLIPQLYRLSPNLSSPSVVQLRLVGSPVRFIKRAMQDRPWFLALDDLQWVDSLCLEQLRYLGRHIPGLPGHPDPHTGLDQLVQDALAALGQEPGYRQMAPDRLDEAGVATLLENLWQQPAPAALVNKIYRRTAGDIFYTEETAKALVDEGYITLRDGRWHFPADVDGLALPMSEWEAVQHRVGLLPEDTQALLRQAAVLGQSFSYADLREISGLSEREMLDRLEPALERQLVLEAPGEGQLRFRHFEIHQVIYGELSVLRRRLLHRQAGESLERRSGGTRIEELAYHFGQAGEDQPAINYGLQAARQAHQGGLLDTALLWYGRVLERVKSPANLNPALELNVHHALSQVLTIVNRYPEALEHCMVAWKLLAQQSRTLERDLQQSDLCYQTALAHEGRSDYPAALEWLHKGRGYLEGLGPTREQARLDFLTGWIAIRQNNLREAWLRLERALETARAARAREVEADCLRAMGVMAWEMNEVARAISYFQQALQGYREVNCRQGEARVLVHLAAMATLQHEYEQAESQGRLALTLFYELGDRTGTGGALNGLALTAWQQGKLAEARQLGEQSLRLRQDGGDRWGKAEVFATLGQIWLSGGDYPRAREHFEQALELQRQIGDIRGEAATLKGLGLLFFYQGNLDTARTLLGRAAESVARLDDWYDCVVVDLALARVNASVDLGSEAQAIYRRILEFEKVRQYYPSLLLQVRMGLAELAARFGNRQEAQAGVDWVLEQLPQVELIPQDEPFWVYWQAARILQQWNDPRRAEILQRATALLHSWATGMDESMQRTFLEQTTIHADLLKWQG